ncbi:GspH/FimT family pseudopilin [Quatrionicoccus australiensis]|uniref:GspH/FimT family pseudopilin n=1 Tax=Quatrionicoccus australiensis TaxID=138118 RepID=UPI001CFB49BA|nr:GspH/FimT family pseudopilin [Quatrionicoccus australiensis]MCB4361260.1 GspH/FimT family pseudopilin [Quatrionicoccus australiensis]
MLHSFTLKTINHRFVPSGFSLVELMVTIAILAILAMMAAPSMQGQIASSRVTAATNDLLTTLAHARSEAVRRGITVTVTATGGDWKNGWTSTAGSSAGAQAGDIQFNNAISIVAFASDGTSANTGTIAVSSTSTYTSKAKSIQILGSGKVFVNE